MGDKTGISWTDATWNPIRGCSRVSEGCRHCYAETVAARFSGPGQPYEGLARRKLTIVNNEERDPGNRSEARWTGEVRFVAERLRDPLRWKKPRRIFVNSMSDLFHEKLTNEQIAAVFGVMAAAPQHTFQVLTKRARRIREWSEWLAREAATCNAGVGMTPASRCFVEAQRAIVPLDLFGRPTIIACGDVVNAATRAPWPLPNVWLGVSVEDQAAADERIPELLRTPAAVRFLSCEPLLGPVQLPVVHVFGNNRPPPGISWVIAGCESGPGARQCSVDWLRSLRDQCAAAGVPYFLKQAQATRLGWCGDHENPNGDNPCGQRVTAYVISPSTAAYSCGCTVEGSEMGAGVPLGPGDGSKRKSGGVIELPYLDGVQWAQFPEVAP